MFTQSYIYLKHAAYQKSHENKLKCKSYTQDTLLLNFKITLNIFGFELNSTNKSCSTKLLEYNKIDLAVFGFFFAISYGFYKLADLNRGVYDFLQNGPGPWRDSNPCNWVLGWATQENRSVPINFRRGGSVAVRGK
jgi:hypothetical protein